jgi:hypothetical protein
MPSILSVTISSIVLFTAPDANNEQSDQNLGKPLIDMIQTGNNMQIRRDDTYRIFNLCVHVVKAHSLGHCFCHTRVDFIKER